MDGNDSRALLLRPLALQQLDQPTSTEVIDYDDDDGGDGNGSDGDAAPLVMMDSNARGNPSIYHRFSFA